MRNAVMPMLLHLDLLDLAAETAQPIPGLDTRQVVENLQRLANGLLLRTTESDNTPAPSPVHLHEWWHEVGDLIRTTLPRGCALRVDLPPALPPVFAQPAVLAQVMLHLMVNAHLALDTEVDCAVSIVATRTRRGVTLTVQDRTAPTAPTASRTSARLTPSWGLALARTLLQRGGGDMTGHCVIGHGTLVSIQLPLAPEGGDAPGIRVPQVRAARATPPVQPRTRAKSGGARTGPDTLTVLCIDDNAALTAALALRLGMDGRFTLLPPWHSLDDSIARLATLVPSIVLLDLNLPGAERPLDVIRALRASGSQTRVIVLTGNPSAEALRATREAGADGFIAKGVAPERLLAALLRVGDGEFVLELDA